MRQKVGHVSPLWDIRISDSGPIHTGRGTRRARKFKANPLMLLVCCLNTLIDDNRSHLLALCCASCANEAQKILRIFQYLKVKRIHQEG